MAKHMYGVCETEKEICEIALKCEEKYWCKRVEFGITSTDFRACPYPDCGRVMIKKKDAK